MLANWPSPDESPAPLGDGRHASAIDRPTTIDDLKQVVVSRVAAGQAVYPQGGRTALGYGGIPGRPGVAVDLSGLNRVIDYPAADMTITVEAGITLADLTRTLDAEGQRLEIDAPQADRATIGGVYATNSTGPRRHGSGRPRDQIIGVGFVNAAGTLIKGGGQVVKNVAGYDFPKLLTGSLGTLGVIARVTVKVRPKPEATAIVWVNYDDVESLGHDLERLNTSSTRPVAVEALNAPAMARMMSDLRASPWSLAIGFEDNAESVAWQADRVVTELSGRVAAVLRDGESGPSWAALREFPATEVGPVSVVANVRLSSVAGMLAAVDPGLWAVQSHAGNGVVRAHASVEDLDAIEADVRRLRALAESAGGNLIVSRCPADRKEAIKVWGDPRPDWAWSERIKETLDPAGVMNPGRFVGRI